MWHGIDHEFVARFSPTLADRFAASTTRSIPAVAAEILRSLAEPHRGAAPGVLPAAMGISTPRYPRWLDDRRIRQGELRITPIFPTRCGKDEFRFSELREYELILNKPGSWHSSISVPLSRLKDPLFSGDNQPVVLVLDRRLQWLSPNREWKVFPDAPTTPQDRLLGFSKFSSSNDPRVRELQAVLANRGATVAFVREDRLAEVLGAGRQIVYDDDGLYFRWQGPDTAQILVATGP